jgi:hypothetical protein
MLAEIHNAAPMTVFAILTGLAAVLSSFIIVDKEPSTQDKDAEKDNKVEDKEENLLHTTENVE